MRLFIIEAYGGGIRSDGPIALFTIRADNEDEAIGMARSSDLGQRYTQFELVGEGEGASLGEAGILAHSEGGGERVA